MIVFRKHTRCLQAYYARCDPRSLTRYFITLGSSRSATSYPSPCCHRPGSRKGILNLPTLRSSLFPIPVIRSTDLSSACYKQTAGHPGAAHLYHRSWMDGRSLKKACQTINMQDALNGPSSRMKTSFHAVSQPIHPLLCHRFHALPQVSYYTLSHTILCLMLPHKANAIQELFGNPDNRFFVIHPAR